MGMGKKKIEIKKKEKQSDRMVTFSKRKKGLFKKSQELHSITGANIAVVVFSPAGRPYAHVDPSFDATVDRYMNTVADDENAATVWKSWLGTLDLEEYNDVEDLLAMKNYLEEIREKLIERIHL